MKQTRTEWLETVDNAIAFDLKLAAYGSRSLAAGEAYHRGYTNGVLDALARVRAVLKQHKPELMKAGK